MINWISTYFNALTFGQIMLFVGIFLCSIIFSFLIIGVVMVKIPANYFSSHYQQDFMPNSRWMVRWGAVVAKNLLGVFLVLLGILLSLPGVPGQGILTILLGLIMLDIPGKRPLEARIIKRPTVRDAINKLRNRFNKPPLILD